MLFTRHNRMVSPLAESGTARRSAGTAPSLQDAGAVERLQSLFLIGTAQDERHVAIVPVRDHPQRNLPQRVDDLVPETFVVPLQTSLKPPYSYLYGGFSLDLYGICTA